MGKLWISQISRKLHQKQPRNMLKFVFCNYLLFYRLSRTFLSDIATSPCLLPIFHKITYKKAMDPQKQKFHIVLIFTEPPNFMKMIQ